MVIDLLKEVERVKPTLQGGDLDHLTGIMTGGAAIPSEVGRKATSLFPRLKDNFRQLYGCTETGPVTNVSFAGDSEHQRFVSSGRPIDHVENKVINPATGLAVPQGEVGEYCTRGYNLMIGYWDEPQKTAEAIDTAGWYHTGDLATMDADGYTRIVGRTKELIIRGGENVYPKEIEELLHTHPDIHDAYVSIAIRYSGPRISISREC